MKKWDELRQKEQALLEKEDKLNQEARQVRQVKELYEDHFNEAGYFMSELHEMYAQNDDSSFYESVKDDFLQESRKIMADLDQDEQVLLKKKRAVQQQIEDIAYDKEKLRETEEAQAGA